MERAGLLKFVEDKSNKILGYNNELAHLQTELEEVQATVMKWYVKIVAQNVQARRKFGWSLGLYRFVE